MCVIRLFVCSGKSSPHDVCRRPGLPHFDAAQVEAILALLPFEQKAFLEAARGDIQAVRLLWGWLYQKAAQRAADEGWRLVRGQERIGGLARVVRDDMLRLDNKNSTVREVAAAVLTCRTEYYLSPWPLRYRWLGGIGEGVVRDATERLKAEFYGSC